MKCPNTSSPSSLSTALLILSGPFNALLMLAVISSTNSSNAGAERASNGFRARGVSVGVEGAGVGEGREKGVEVRGRKVEGRRERG